MSRAIALIGHGSRRAEGNADVFALAERLRQRCNTAVTVGFIELAEPTAETALDEAAALADEVVALPAVLLAAAHAKNDVPLAVVRARLRHPERRFYTGRPLGVHPAMIEILADRFRAAAPPVEAERTAALVVGRGSSDPDANGDLARLARLFSERRGLMAVDVAFAGVTTPDVEGGLLGLLARRPKGLVVLPYLISPGVVLERIQAKVAEISALHPRTTFAVAGPVGTHPSLEDALLDRAEEAVQGTGGMACDACKYRVPLEGFAGDVGGLNALRRSAAHLSLPNAPDAAPHGHAPPRRHVLVCVNRDCADRGAVATLNRLRTRARGDERDREIRITRAMCLGRCGEGPVVAVYPDAVWYRRLGPDEADALYEQHLVEGRPLGHLIDMILG